MTLSRVLGLFAAVTFLCVSWAAGAIQLNPVLTGLSQPVFLTSANDGANRLFVVERTGTIRVLQPGATAATIFLDIHSKITTAGQEEGLLGLAFHPSYRTNGRFFVFYTRSGDGALVVSEFHVSSDPLVANTAETVLLTIAHPTNQNHNGGMLAFGPDGYLYIGTGDGGSANDPPNNAQNVQVLLGKILRIDVDHPDPLGIPYSIPPDNPFVNAPGADEIFAFGLRNPWRFSFDRSTGQMWVGDVGQGAREEVDTPIVKGGNYGWRVYEGTLCTNNDPALCNPANYLFPVLEYGHTVGRCSITGGYVYRGAAGVLPSGTYVYADYCTGEIFTWNGSSQNLLVDTTYNISSFGEDQQGELYVVDLNGTVSRLVATAGATTTTLASSKNPSTEGESITLTATVAGTTPTGGVAFTESGTPVNGCSLVPLTGTGNSKTAACTIAALSAGSHGIVATYAGDATNQGSSSVPLSQIVNGAGPFANLGFEAPNLGGNYQYSPNGAAWTFVSAGVTGNGNPFTAGNPSAPEGVQVAFLQGAGSSATQTANLAAGQYTISFKAAQRGNFQFGTQIVQVQVDGVSIGQFQPPGTTYAAFQTSAFTITTAGSHTIALRGIGSGSDFTAFVDDLRITAAAAGSLANLGFEAPNLAGGYQYSPNGASWSFVGAGITGNANAFTSGNPTAPEGVQVAFLQGAGSSATQSAAIAAGQYTISMKAAQRGNYQFGTQIVQVQVDGAVVGQFQPPSTAYAAYQTPAFTIVNSGSHTIALLGIGSGSDFTAFVDDVHLNTAAASVLANPGFESPNLAGSYQYAPAGASWTFVSSAGITGNGNAFTSGNPAAPEGAQVAFIQVAGSMSQTANMAAGQYSIRFNAAQRGNYQFGTQVVQVQVDGSVVGQFQPPSTSYTPFETPLFAVAAGNHSMALIGAGSGSDYTAFVDDVQVIAH